MANISKAERRAQALERRAKRDAAHDELMSARLRTGIGFAAAYVGTQVLPRFAPTLAANQTVLDLLLVGGGAYFAFTDDSELGDYATGVALVGATQTLDRLVTTLEGWLDA